MGHVYRRDDMSPRERHLARCMTDLERAASDAHRRLADARALALHWRESAEVWKRAARLRAGSWIAWACVAGVMLAERCPP